MQLIPAIDLIGGRCVRLKQGDFQRVTYYDADPVELAREYESDGADALHVVDLEGAQRGRSANGDAIGAICAAVSIPVQVGGGIRGAHDVGYWLDRGAARAVVGTSAVTEPEVVADWLLKFGSDRICLALDVQLDAGGQPRVVTHAWQKTSPYSLWLLLAQYYVSARYVLCTDIARDGLAGGSNPTLYQDASRRFPAIDWQASGGVGCLDDLQELDQTGVSACIIGRALVERVFTLGEAFSCLRAA